MDTNVINELQNGLSAAYINGSVAANLAYKPAFVSNNPEDGKYYLYDIMNIKKETSTPLEQ